MFQVNAEYLRHDGGTKFYEAVLIREQGGQAMLIKRYGSIDKMNGGGQTLIERGSPFMMSAAYQKIIEEKSRMRPGKGRYEAAKLDWGVHKLDGMPVGAGLLGISLGHWHDKDDRSAIYSYFNLGRDTTASGISTDIDLPDEPEINRGAGWATW